MLAEVQGQDEGVSFLRSFVEGKLASPLLLVGEQGIGRRFSVVQAVKEVFCTGTKEAGCECFDCTAVTLNTHSDFMVVVPEADKDIGVAKVRELTEEALRFPLHAPIRVILIDGADRMTGPAANAFLKTLEEPPARTKFFLLAESFDRMLPTIQSRCGKVSYQPLHEGFILSVVQQFETDPAKALVYARMGEGSVGRALHYWGSGRLGLRDRVYSLLQFALKGDVSALFLTVDGIAQDLSLGLRFLDQLLYDIFMVAHDSTRLINQDLTEGISELRNSVSFDTLLELSAGVRALRSERAKVSLPFHVKTLFSRTLLVN